jgi:cell division protein FtsI (penicillin-binding protein 3)
MEKMGMLSPVPIELPEVGRPIYPKHWRKINLLTIAFGHGISVTPLHVVTGTAAVVNGGIYYPPTLVHHSASGHQQAGRRVISERTSRQMRDLLRVVVAEGTGKSAEVPGYEVGGKTGTAEKAGKSGYREKALISSFIGVFPMRAPKYVVLVSVDEPKGIKETGGYATGGYVGAPSVKAIIEHIITLYGIQPVDPVAAAKLLAASPAPAHTAASTPVAATAPKTAAPKSAASGRPASAPPTLTQLVDSATGSGAPVAPLPRGGR